MLPPSTPSDAPSGGGVDGGGGLLGGEDFASGNPVGAISLGQSILGLPGQVTQGILGLPLGLNPVAPLAIEGTRQILGQELFRAGTERLGEMERTVATRDAEVAAGLASPAAYGEIGPGTIAESAQFEGGPMGPASAESVASTAATAADAPSADAYGGPAAAAADSSFTGVGSDSYSGDGGGGGGGGGK